MIFGRKIDIVGTFPKGTHCSYSQAEFGLGVLVFRGIMSGVKK